MISWAIFVSGEGTNLQSVLELERDRLKNSQIKLVLADRPCFALERAKKFQKPVAIVNPKENAFEDQMLAHLRAQHIDAIFLLGFMRILKSNFLSQFKGPIINLHPSLLPKFKGAHAVRGAIDAGESHLGVSLHHVVEAVDSGKILRQIRFARDPRWTWDQTMQEVHANERKIVSEFLIDLEENPSIVQD